MEHIFKQLNPSVVQHNLVLIPTNNPTRHQLHLDGEQIGEFFIVGNELHFWATLKQPSRDAILIKNLKE